MRAYPAKLQKYAEAARQRRFSAAAEGTVLASAERTSSELAYTEILQEMKADFPNIGWEALRNKHTAWKNGHFHRWKTLSTPRTSTPRSNGAFVAHK